jgi:hypothetical protein
MDKPVCRGNFQLKVAQSAGTRINSQSDAQRDGRFFLKHLDRLWHAIFEQLKIVSGQISHWSAAGVSDRREDVHQPDIHSESGFIFLGLRPRRDSVSLLGVLRRGVYAARTKQAEK